MALDPAQDEPGTGDDQTLRAVWSGRDIDAREGHRAPWEVIAAEHADEIISGIYVTVGFSAGTNLTGCLRTLSVNENVFLLGS